MQKKIRWVVKSDTKVMAEIEKKCYTDLWDKTWTEKDFIACLSNRNKIGKVIEENGIVVGFIIYELKPLKFDIYNIAVLPEYQRRGYGTALVQQIINKLKNGNRREIDVPVCETYLQAHLFFRNLGFKATAVKRNFFDDGKESFDAYIFNYSINIEAMI